MPATTMELGDGMMVGSRLKVVIMMASLSSTLGNSRGGSNARRFVGSIAVLGLVASACGSSSGGDSAETGVSSQLESPLGEFLGYSNDFNSEDAQAEYKEQERLVQEQVVSCMRAEGFEYYAIEEGGFEDFLETEEFEWGSPDYIKKYGYGVTTQRWSQEVVGPDLVGHNYENFDSGTVEEGDGDLNFVYRESLPSGEQQAYDEALYGTDDGFEWDESLSEEETEAAADDYYENEYEPSGCLNIAWDGANNGADFQAFEDQFGDVLEEMEERFEADPRAVAILKATEDCVSDAGFEYDEDDVEQDLYKRLEEVGNSGSRDPFEGIDFETLSDEEIEEAVREAEKLSPEDLLKLAEIQEYELELSAAVAKCNGGSLYSFSNPELQKIRVEMEQEFLDANKDELAEFEGIGR